MAAGYRSVPPTCVAPGTLAPMPHRRHLPTRWTIGRVQNPVRGLLHGPAALAALAGLAWLLFDSPGGISRKAALAVFGLSLVALFTISTLYHTVPWRRIWKLRMQRADHAAIFAVVAGSYTPLAVIVFDGWLTWVTLAMAWGIAAVGVAQLAFFPRETVAFSIALNTTLGCLAVLFLKALVDRLPWTAIALLMLGGVLYLVGMIALVSRRPRLWPRVFSYHEAFHVLVVAAAAVYWFTIWRWVAPFAA